MQNQKGNLSVIISLVIVLGIVGYGVYYLSTNTKDTNTESEKNITEKNNPTDSKGSINNNPTDSKSESNKTSMNQTKRLLQNFKPVTKVASLEKIDTVVGKGEEVKAGATVSVHYTGAVAATGEIFQSSKDFGTDPVTFPLSGVIKGWTDGIPGMKVGGTRRLIIPAAQAYGATPPPS